MLNSSLKSELTNLFAFDDERVNNQFPGGGKTRLVGLRLPKLQVESPVHVFDFSCALNKPGSRN